MSNDETDLSSDDYNNMNEVRISINNTDVTGSLESFEIDIDNDQYVIKGSASIANVMLEDDNKHPLVSSYKVYPRGFSKYYEKIKEYVSSLPKGAKLFSYDISEKLRINVQIVEGILKYLVDEGELKINA